MSHKAIYGQPVPGNLQEGKAFTFQCSPISLLDRKTMFENLPVCYQSGHVVKVVKVASCDNALTPCKLSQDGGEDCYKVPGFAFWFLDVLIVSILLLLLFVLDEQWPREEEAEQEEDSETNHCTRSRSVSAAWLLMATLNS